MQLYVDLYSSSGSRVVFSWSHYPPSLFCFLLCPFLAMVLPEADNSASPVDEGSFAPSQPQTKDLNDGSFQPNSSKLVIFNQRSG
ncbi:hypothetical protein L202_08016 [Cryptococcus amylolentus CBS 6039]|uniref:Uncharacterized protein n=1 Tax=Cryptococcus amylolentus CBS 6039 TaxID=1295533 RepID=A0A1E3HCM0_9TREE|nr:hypothetical protein L202_08016 [Cryptococcus amylolentus CBS 6039]ODN73516.1 hypothetical protein L202_08016 [Cryptococcus amylolentus CBS 6039]